MLAERWQRAAFAQQKWAERARECVNFFEGQQYTEEQKAKLKFAKRPAFRFNVIAPVVRLVIGYQRANKTDITFQASHDDRSSEATAKALTQLEKAVATGNMQDYVDVEVFMDGLIAGRGYFRTVLDFENNDLGEIKRCALDPFSVYPDPDAYNYDLTEGASYIQHSKYTSIDEIEATFGKKVADLVSPFTKGMTPLMPISSLMINDEITPARYFGERTDALHEWWDDFYSMMGDWVDTHRKTIRIIETEYKVRENRNVIIDLETGDKKVLPETWGDEQIQKCLLYAEAVGNPCVVQNRMVERIHWTTMCGDLLLYDAPSFYNSYSITGYFPYFRRGMTRGMVDDLIDPQIEKNKRRNSEIEMLAKTANGGWLIPKNSLDPVQRRRLDKFGSAPGVVLEYDVQANDTKPEQITPQVSTANHERLEAKADEDIRRISGINESALGDTDISNQSGRAIEARQRQATISVQMYMDNFKRTKHLLGEHDLSIFQNYYTEPRIYRITGDDGKLAPVQINQVIQDPAAGAKRIINDVTLGKYAVVIDDAPLSATFLNAQFEEMMAIVEKLLPAIGQQLPAFADLIIGMSTLPRKEEWIAKLQAMQAAAMAQAGAPPPGSSPAQGGGAPPAPGGNVVPLRG